jgi:hypothetical protein
MRTLGQTLSATPQGFDQHASWYAHHPEQLAATPLSTASPDEHPPTGTESVTELLARLEPHRAYYRIMTPTPVATHRLAFAVRVVVPGLQPLAGHHELAALGGPLWAPRAVSEYATMPPHPFA